MRLPDGAEYSPGRLRLIAFDEPAWVRLRSDAPKLGQYTIKDRSFESAILPYCHGDWGQLGRLSASLGGQAVYSGADHGGMPPLPSITVLPNFRPVAGSLTGEVLSILGCTMGHWHPVDPVGERTQELYEFQSPGLMVLDREQGEVDVWVLRGGDKVAVPSGCHMTLYNLGDDDQPLVTLDFADPRRNPADKSLISRKGPILLAYRSDTGVVFALNELYLNARDHRAGVRVDGEVSAERRRVVISLAGDRPLGEDLYLRLTQDPTLSRRFSELGLRLRVASSEVVLEDPGDPVRSRKVTRPLVDAVQPGQEACRFFLGERS